jgi:predicted nucleic acid-binding protein
VIALLDSSVILRRLFGEPNPLAEWGAVEHAYASRLVPLEIARTIDRARLDGRIDDHDVAALHEEARRVLRSVDVLALTEPIFERASQPMPTLLGSLDAIHLATGLELARALDRPLVLATHDGQLGRAARASGLDVCGC